MDPPTLLAFVVGSVNGLICLCNRAGQMFIWNPTISKSKELLNSKCGTSIYIKYGFGYDELHDDYKAIFVDYSYHNDNDDVSKTRNVVNVYSLRADSWTTVDDQLHGIYLVNRYGDILLSLPGYIMIFDGSTKKFEHTPDVKGSNPPEIYAESIVNPLMISGKILLSLAGMLVLHFLFRQI
uniref:F-box domain-containing protein n=1 Tax=Solanum tuberosum TaxID=4113 RepID=M1AVF8_SOLTU